MKLRTPSRAALSAARLEPSVRTRNAPGAFLIGCVALGALLMAGSPAPGAEAEVRTLLTAPPLDASHRPAPEVTAPRGASVAAVTPQVILYQGRLTEESGAPRGGPVSLIVALYPEATGGVPIWNEAHIGVPLTDGIFSVLLGSVNTFPFNAFNSADRFLGLSVDGQPEMTPRLRLASVPYALESERVGGKRATDFEPLGQASLAAAGVQSQLQGSDANPPNQGSNQVHWNNLWGMPGGFVDGNDDIGTGVNVHAQLQGLSANDHPQYVLGEVLQVTDGSPPNLGTNRVHWDNLGGVPIPLSEQSLPKSWIQASSLDSTRVATGGLAGRNLRIGTITADRLAPGAVGSAQIADGSLPGTKLQAGTVTGNQIQNGSLTGVDLQDESIQTNDITNGTLLGVDMATGAVTGLIILDDTVGSIDLKDGSVTGADMADTTLAGIKLKAGAVGERELAVASVTSAAVRDSSLTSVDLKDAPGVAFRSITGFVDTVETSTPKILTTLTLTVPGPGWLTVRAGCQASFIHDLGHPTRVTVAVGLTPDLADSAAATIALPGNFPTELYQFPLAPENVFPVAAPGPVTVYVVAARGVQLRVPSINNLRLQAHYTPRRY